MTRISAEFSLQRGYNDEQGNQTQVIQVRITEHEQLIDIALADVTKEGKAQLKNLAEVAALPLKLKFPCPIPWNVVLAGGRVQIPLQEDK